jgi:hypothetical protein
MSGKAKAHPTSVIASHGLAVAESQTRKLTFCVIRRAHSLGMNSK